MLGTRFALVWLLLLALPTRAQAESWCAYPLWAHEWGVQLFNGAGKPESPLALPKYFHRAAPAKTAAVAHPVRGLAADSGLRELPALHFYSAGSMAEVIPVGIEVGFSRGAASAWYPQVDTLIPEDDAHGLGARAGRRRLLSERKKRQDLGPMATASMATAPVADPTRQLHWERLELTAQPRHSLQPADSWVGALRDFPALYVNNSSESERFVFYEAGTREELPLAFTRGEKWRPEQRHLRLHNRGKHPVHDVFVVLREKASVSVFFAPSIPAGTAAGFIVEDHWVEATKLAAATVRRLKDRLVDSAMPTPPTKLSWANEECVMGRDPAIPVEQAEGHRLFSHEAEALLALWGKAMFQQPGLTVVYREDVGYLEELMPLSLYTDMYQHLRLRRTGLAVWQNAPLPGK